MTVQSGGSWMNDKGSGYAWPAFFERHFHKSPAGVIEKGGSGSGPVIFFSCSSGWRRSFPWRSAGQALTGCLFPRLLPQAWDRHSPHSSVFPLLFPCLSYGGKLRYARINILLTSRFPDHWGDTRRAGCDGSSGAANAPWDTYLQHVAKPLYTDMKLVE